jgi:hypothetical protein
MAEAPSCGPVRQGTSSASRVHEPGKAAALAELRALVPPEAKEQFVIFSRLWDFATVPRYSLQDGKLVPVRAEDSQKGLHAAYEKLSAKCGAVWDEASDGAARRQQLEAAWNNARASIEPAKKCIRASSNAVGLDSKSAAHPKVAVGRAGDLQLLKAIIPPEASREFEKYAAAWQAIGRTPATQVSREQLRGLGIARLDLTDACLAASPASERRRISSELEHFWAQSRDAENSRMRIARSVAAATPHPAEPMMAEWNRAAAKSPKAPISQEDSLQPPTIASGSSRARQISQRHRMSSHFVERFSKLIGLAQAQENIGIAEQRKLEDAWALIRGLIAAEDAPASDGNRALLIHRPHKIDSALKRLEQRLLPNQGSAERRESHSTPPSSGASEDDFAQDDDSGYDSRVIGPSEALVAHSASDGARAKYMDLMRTT